MWDTFGGASVARRVVVLGGALVIGLSLVASPLRPTAAADEVVFTCGMADITPDPDLVVGAPNYPGGGILDIRTPTEDNEFGASRTLPAPSLVGTNPMFGAAASVVGLDGDACNDLVVGAPGVDGVGAAYLIFSTASGTGTGPRVRLPYAGSPGDRFGSSLAVEGRRWANRGQPVVGDVRIWVGIPGRDVAGRADAGAVAYYTVSALGQVSGPTVYTQNSPGVPGTAEAGDRFGQVLTPLASGVVIGQPGEDNGTKTDAGMITVLPAPDATPTGPGPYAATEDTPGIPGAAEAGDRFGAALTWRPPPYGALWVGAPGEDVGAVRDTGMVHGLQAGGSSFRSLSYTSQNSPGVAGANEPGDHFGASLEIGELSGLFRCGGPGVAIGAPGEDIGDVRDAGMVTMLRCPTAFREGPDARAGDMFGAALGFFYALVANVPSTLFVGIPGQDLGSNRDVGAVQALNRHQKATLTLSSGALPGLRYGTVIATYALNYI